MEDRIGLGSTLEVFERVIARPVLVPVLLTRREVFLRPAPVLAMPWLSISKLRVDGNRPAYFLALVEPTNNSEDCRVRVEGIHDGIVCPRHGWDFRNELSFP